MLKRMLFFLASPRVARIGCIAALTGLMCSACGGSAVAPISDAPDAGDTTSPTIDAGAPTPIDGSMPSPVVDAGAESGISPINPMDGTPTRTAACTPLSQQTGTAINTTHGRLDGFLTYFVPQGGEHSCNGDDSHVHLQIRANGNIYDVAVDIGMTPGDVELLEADQAIPGGAWAEGWHGADDLSYPQIGLHATQFTAQNPAPLGKKLQDELTNANHVSVFGTGYTQGNGCHDVHYVGRGSTDGALVLNPLGPTPHILYFHFSTQSF